MRRRARRRNRFNLRLYFLVLGISLAAVLVVFGIAMASGIFSNQDDVIDNEIITEDLIEPVDKATGKINVLLLGVDVEGLRTDTIMIASYDLDKNKVNILSIPRDTRMYVGSSYQKINAAHAITQKGKIKGPQGTIEAVTRLTGIPVNYYVEFNFATFRNTIDVLGGVYFDVPRNMKYSDPIQKLYIDLKKGYQLLDGDKAEQLVRFRRYPEGDIARVRMQQDFLKALCEQKLNASIIAKIPDLFEQLSEDINTNFKLVDIVKYLPNVSELSSDSINMYQLPGGYNDDDYGASYWICNISETKTLIQENFGYNASKITIHSADGSSKSKDRKIIKPTAIPTEMPEETDGEMTEITETQKPEGTTSPTSAPTTVPTMMPTTEPDKTSDIDKESDGEKAETLNPSVSETAEPEKAPKEAEATEKPAETPAPVEEVTEPVDTSSPAEEVPSAEDSE